MIGCSYDLRFTRDNNLMVEDIPSKNILKPTSNYIVHPHGHSVRSKTLGDTFMHS